MVKLYKSLVLVFVLTLNLSHLVLAERNIDAANRPQQPKGAALSPLLAGCQPPNSKAELNVNNVRTLVLNAGDFWWDLDNAKYEIPKIDPPGSAQSKHSLFSGSLWFGGLDGGQIKVAGQTYRQNGVTDYWAGPLDDKGPTKGTITEDECRFWDKHFSVYQTELDEYLLNMDCIGYDGSGNCIRKAAKPGYTIPSSIEDWPGNGRIVNQEKMLAPFFDLDKDGLYEPKEGDHPIYGYNGTKTEIVKPDQFIWWVQNDAGNTHTAYSTPAIGLEIQSTAFAFRSSNSLNNTTFYRNTIINRGNVTLDSAYFGVHVDADLGYAFDDYIGCDVKKSLGICYNGTDEDPPGVGFNGYGLNPPSVGVDFFKGPRDENGNLLGMAKFTYFNNTSDIRGNPSTGTHIYNYLRGIWKDGTRMTYGGSGYSATSKDYCDYLFPGLTDPQGRRNWTEYTEGNVPNDRRFVQSAGPFRLLPGARNEVVFGVVWARATSGGATGSFNDLLKADIEAQNLFNKDFLFEHGPKTPDIVVTELDRKLIISLVNTKESESYSKDVQDVDQAVTRYKFQGYKLYQLKNAQVSATELDNPDRAKLLATVDIKDDAIRIVNLVEDPEVDAEVPVLKAQGENQGLRHVFEIINDQFASGTTLVNHKTYYFTLIAYAYSEKSRSEHYLQGIDNVETYSGIPHKTNPQYGGSALNSDFGSGPKITRITGTGNGGNLLELTKKTHDAIMESAASEIEYENTKGPITVKVIDPNKLPDHEFELKIIGLKKWELTDIDTKEVFVSDVTDTLGDNEQVIGKYGFSVIVRNAKILGTNFIDDIRNSFIGAEINYEDPTNQWLQFLANKPASNEPTSGGINNNWIKLSYLQNPTIYDSLNLAIDPKAVYRDILSDYGDSTGGKFAPYRFVSKDQDFGPAPLNPLNDSLQNLPSIDLVLTDNKDLWSKCVVVESQRVPTAKGKLRKKDIGYGQGRGVFPGYAINVETGERLNLFFAEDSTLAEDNGTDMLFNPTQEWRKGKPVNGGKHYIYVHNSRYDECSKIYDALKGSPNSTKMQQVYLNVGWVCIPLLKENKLDEYLKNKVTIKLRVKRPYADFPSVGNAPHYKFDMTELASLKNNGDAAKSALDLIGVVPNPYYAFSEYERSEVDSRVKIINVPGNCTVTIYTMNGTLVRKLSKSDDNITSLDWDLKNSNGVPVASGVYLFNIRTTIDGKSVDKVVRWFGVTRPLDLNTF